MRTPKQLLVDRSGATAIEYGFIAMLISLSIIAGATLIGNELEETFGTIETELIKSR